MFLVDGVNCELNFGNLKEDGEAIRYFFAGLTVFLSLRRLDVIRMLPVPVRSRKDLSLSFNGDVTQSEISLFGAGFGAYSIQK